MGGYSGHLVVKVSIIPIKYIGCSGDQGEYQIGDDQARSRTVMEI